MKKKSMHNAGIPAEIDAGIACCHAWLNEHSEPPVALKDLSPEERTVALEAARADPRYLAALGPPEREEPESRSGLVRTLLRVLLATKQFQELPDHLRLAKQAGNPSALLLDDSKTRAAIPKLSSTLQVLATLWDDAATRHAGLSGFGLESEPNLRTLALLDEVGASLNKLIGHLRALPGTDCPRSLAELIRFRVAWTDMLSGAGFKPEEIAGLLGQRIPTNPGARERLRDSVRKVRARARRRNASAAGSCQPAVLGR